MRNVFCLQTNDLIMEYITKSIAIFLICGSIFKVDISYTQSLRLELPAHMSKDQFEVISLKEAGGYYFTGTQTPHST